MLPPRRLDHMSRREIRILWWGIALIVTALAFPPYGYDRIRTIFISRSTDIYSSGTSASTSSVPWTYVGHAFILSPIRRDRDLDNRAKENNEEYSDIGLTSYTPYIEIAWHILAAEIISIALITAAALFTARTAGTRK